MSELTQDDIATGYAKFLACHPSAVERVNGMTQAVADALGVTLEELRRVETAKALNDAAGSQGIDGFEYLLRYAIDDEIERDRILQRRQEAQERALGLRR